MARGLWSYRKDSLTRLQDRLCFFVTPYVLMSWWLWSTVFIRKKSMILPVPSSDWSPELECDGDGAERGSASAALAPPMSPLSAWGDNSCLSSSLDAPFSFSVSAAELITTVNRTELSYPTGQKYSLELMFAKFATAKIAKYLNPQKISFNRL